MNFHTRLTHELTELDRRECAAEARRRYAVNHYRLALYLGAAQETVNDIEAGATPAAAFASHFTPTRGMHTVARRLNLGLDVQRGRWILP
jgi:hypothetical protein